MNLGSFEHMLTERQEAILAFVREFQAREGVPPSTRAIQRRFGFRSQTTAVRDLRTLAAAGRVVQLADRSWGLKRREALAEVIEVPIYGSIPAGLPAMQEEEPEGTVAISPTVFGVRPGKAEHLWFLRVSGDSMIGARIFDGDLVALIRRDPQPGDIIAALVDETSTTLKRLVRERGRAILRAENPQFADVLPKRLESQGVVVGVIRRQMSG